MGFYREEKGDGMSREELKDIVCAVVERLGKDAPTPACGLFWADDPQPTTRYAVGEEDVTTYYAVGEEDMT